MENTKNCSNCGAQIPSDAVMCPVCGVNLQSTTGNQGQQNTVLPINQNQTNQEFSEKDKSTTTILAILPFVTPFHGIHRFYTGHIGIGVIQFITLGGCWIWTIIDLIQILQGKFTDAEGKLLKGKDIF